MLLRRTHLMMSAGLLLVLPGVLAVRRVARAQRRTDEPVAVPTSAPAVNVTAERPRPTTISNVVEGFDPARCRREGDHYTAELPQGQRAVLSLDVRWQRAVQALLEAHHLPRASVVLMETDTGRVRIYASRAEPGAPDLARDTAPPAASVFKIVTAGALVGRGLSDTTETCYDGGGFHALRPRDLESNPARDRECVSLANAFGRSINTVFARRALNHLTPNELETAARAWGFGEAVPFDAPVRVGELEVPTDRVEFARTAAGFWHSHLSPMHGAMMAQAIARGGELYRPYMIEQVLDAQGNVVSTGASRVWRRAVSPEVATALSRMMQHSVSEGTALRAFHDNAGHSFLPDVEVGGKTGTLTAANPYRAYTWFVGNASGTIATRPARFSFAVLVGNDPVWRVKAATVARQVLQIVYRGRATD